MNQNVARITNLVTQIDDTECFLGSVCPPTFETTIFKIPDFDTAEKMSAGEDVRYSYSRTDGNPTLATLGRLLAAMENGEAAKTFASGTTAIFTAMISCLKKGDHVVIDRNAYGRAIGFLRNEFARFGVDHTFVDASDIDQVRAAIRPETTLFYLESPCSWLFNVHDFRALTKLAKEHGIKTITDNTYSTPVFQNPIDMGVDIVVHSATKYLGGHSATIGGVIVSTEDFIRNIAQVEGNLSTHEASKLLLNLRTLPLRMERHYENAKAVAAFLEQSDKVSHVFYPGSPNHPQYDLIQRQMYGASGLLSFTLDCDRSGSKRFFDALRHISIGGSWGSYETVIYSTDFQRDFVDNSEFTTLLPHHNRFSVGLEDIDLLLSELESALRAV